MTKNKKHVDTESHLTSVITENKDDIEKDPLSKEINIIRNDILALGLSDLDKTHQLLFRFKDLLDDNCNRVKRIYEDHKCRDVTVEPAIGYFIPDVNKKDALFFGAEPSTIVTANDLTEDGLHKFLLSSGIVGQQYKQQSEILKFPITKEKFNKYVKKKLNNNSDIL